MNKSQPPREQGATVGNAWRKLTPGQMLETLTLYVRHQSTNRVAEELGITGPAVRDRLRSMGVKLRPQGHSDADVTAINGKEFLHRLMKELEAACADSELANSVGSKGRGWTSDEDMRLPSELTAAELAAEIGRSANAVRARRYHSGVRRRPPTRQWTPDEDAAARVAAHGEIEHVAALMGRTPRAVYQRRWRLLHGQD